MKRIVFALIALVALAAISHADPEPPAPTPSEPHPQPDPDATPAEPVAESPTPPIELHTTDSVRGSPRFGEESGRIDPDPGEGNARKVGRILLWGPRLAVRLIALPVRGVLYLNDHYHVIRRTIDVFRTDDHQLALYPTALFASGFGLNVGFRGYLKNVFGEGERFYADAGFGGEEHWTVGGGAHSGERFGPVKVWIGARRAARDQDEFYGYGNDDSAVDPTVGQIAPIGYNLQLKRAVARIAISLPAHFRITGTTGITSKRFGTDDLVGAPMLEGVPGFTAGTEFVYDELELAWDTRRAAHPWDAPGMRGTGGLAMIFGGYQQGLGDEPAFVRAGFDLQRYLRLSSGPRVLELRLAGEMVTGSRDEVPFSELPRLGGQKRLRGYETDRFRDRVAVVAQASYSWAAASWLAPALFVDVGRVYSGLDTLSFDNPRVGFGAALEGYRTGGMVARVEVASSIDGGLFVYLALNPAFDAGARVERY